METENLRQIDLKVALCPNPVFSSAGWLVYVEDDNATLAISGGIQYSPCFDPTKMSGINTHPTSGL